MICRECGYEIEEGERYFHIEDEGCYLCEKHFIEWAVDRIQDDVEETADRLGIPWNFNNNPFAWDDARDRGEY